MSQKFAILSFFEWILFLMEQMCQCQILRFHKILIIYVTSGRWWRTFLITPFTIDHRSVCTDISYGLGSGRMIETICNRNVCCTVVHHMDFSPYKYFISSSDRHRIVPFRQIPVAHLVCYNAAHWVNSMVTLLRRRKGNERIQVLTYYKGRRSIEKIGANQLLLQFSVVGTFAPIFSILLLPL